MPAFPPVRANRNQPDQFPEHHPIPENSSCLKFASAIPFFGIPISLANECSLARKIEEETDSNRLIELIEVKNNYILTKMLSGVIGVVLLVIAAVVGLFKASLLYFALVTPISLGILIGLNVHRIVHNNELIKTLKSTGTLPPDSEVC